MGSLAYAVGGGLAGAGKGIAEVGQEEMHAQVQQGLLRMQKQYAEEMQQRQFTQQESMMGKEQAFQRSLKEEELRQGSAIAAANRAMEYRKMGLEFNEKKYASDSSYAARVDSMYLRIMAAQNKGGKGGGKVWDHVSVNVGQPIGPDGKPDITAPPIQKPGIVNNRTGRMYAPQGGMYVPWDNDKQQPITNPAARSRAKQPSNEEIRDLLTDPEGKIADGPNKGLYKSDVFEHTYGGLPSTFFNAVGRESAPGLSESTSGSLTLPSGRRSAVGVPQTGVNVGPDLEQDSGGDLNP